MDFLTHGPRGQVVPWTLIKFEDFMTYFRNDPDRFYGMLLRIDKLELDLREQFFIQFKCFLIEAIYSALAKCRGTNDSLRYFLKVINNHKSVSADGWTLFLIFYRSEVLEVAGNSSCDNAY